MSDKVESPQWASVPAFVLMAEVSDRAVRVWGLIQLEVREDAAPFPSRRRLAERAHCSVDSIDRAMRELIAAGLVKVEERFERTRTGQVRQTSNVYHLRQTPRSSPSRNGAAPQAKDRSSAAPPSRKPAAGGAASTRHQELPPEELPPEELTPRDDFVAAVADDGTLPGIDAPVDPDALERKRSREALSAEWAKVDGVLAARADAGRPVPGRNGTPRNKVREVMRAFESSPHPWERLEAALVAAVVMTVPSVEFALNGSGSKRTRSDGRGTPRSSEAWGESGLQTPAPRGRTSS